jgi:hypothetical protein
VNWDLEETPLDALQPLLRNRDLGFEVLTIDGVVENLISRRGLMADRFQTMARSSPESKS